MLHLYTNVHIAYRNRLLGTPKEETWPGVSALPDFKKDFPNWTPQAIAAMIPQLDADGIDLLQVLSCCIVSYCDVMLENAAIRAGQEDQRQARPAASLL